MVFVLSSFLLVCLFFLFFVLDGWIHSSIHSSVYCIYVSIHPGNFLQHLQNLSIYPPLHLSIHPSICLANSFHLRKQNYPTKPPPPARSGKLAIICAYLCVILLRYYLALLQKVCVFFVQCRHFMS